MTITLIKNGEVIYHHKIARLVVHEDGSITATEYYPLYNDFVSTDWNKKEFDYIEVGDK